MKMFGKCALLPALLACLFGSALRAQTQVLSPKAASNSTQGHNQEKSKGKGSGNSKTPGSDNAVSNQERKNDTGGIEIPDKPSGPGYSDDLKKLIDDFKQAQTKFLDEQKQRREKLKEATEDDRDRLRA